MPPRPLIERPWLVGLLCALGSLALYSAVVRFDFVLFDDNFFVYENRMVRSGLNWASFKWAMTETWAMWFPLTRLSHLVDSAVWGPRPGGHHLTSALLHALNTALFFGVARRVLGHTGLAALVALLFGFHPLNVEAVAWVSGRKEVLCGTFFLAAVLGYLRAPLPRRGRDLALVAGCYLAALMAKPMALTLPAVLLLLDGWPLRRLVVDGRVQWACFKEKWPLALLAAGFSVLTFFAQADIGATGDARTFPFAMRLANACVSAARYLQLTVAPVGLSAFYPHPYGSLSGWKVATACALLALVTVLAWRQRRARPHLLVGWLWWAGMLVPVIGLVQIGRQAMADHYAYLPTLGLWLALGAEVNAWRLSRRVLLGALAAAVLAAGVTASAQVGVWADTETLFQHAREVTPGTNWEAEMVLGSLRQKEGKLEEAVACYRRAAEALTEDPPIQAKLLAGLLPLLPGAEREAQLRALEQAAQERPTDPDAQLRLAAVYGGLGRWPEAEAHYRATLALEPRYTTARLALEEARARGLLPP